MSLKKRYKIIWIRDYGIGRLDPNVVVGFKIIETPAQYVFNQLVDMLNYWENL